MIVVKSENSGKPQPGEVWVIGTYYYLVLQGNKAVCVGASDHEGGFLPFLSDSSGSLDVLFSQGRLVTQHPKIII